jgi:hypothetical protein
MGQPAPNRWSRHRPPERGLESEVAPLLGGLMQLGTLALLFAAIRDGVSPAGVAAAAGVVAVFTFALGVLLAQRTHARNQSRRLGYALALLGLAGWLVTLRLSQRPSHNPNPEP